MRMVSSILEKFESKVKGDDITALSSNLKIDVEDFFKYSVL